MEDICVILGAGGHARVLIDCLQCAGTVRLHGVLDRDSSTWGGKLLDVPVLGGDALLEGLAKGAVNVFVVGVGGIGDSRPRRKLFSAAVALGLRPLTVRHPSSVVSRWASVGQGCQLLPLSVVNAGAVLETSVIVNSGAVVEHDCALGEFVHIAPGAKLASGVRVGAGAHIGLGACVRQGIVVGEGAMVGAGAVVVKDVAPNSVVVGVPARPRAGTA